MNAKDPQILVIFGASGDLTYRKLIPAIYDLYSQDLLPPCFAVLGVSRTQFSDEEFREKMREGIDSFSRKKPDDRHSPDEFLKMIYYQDIDTKNTENYQVLKDRLAQLDESCDTRGNYIYYLATPPSLYEPIAHNLATHQLNQEDSGWKRLIVEKPFGYSLPTAQDLNQSLQSVFRESQLYRIDHYLGKETVQNLLVTRFSNGIFEPLWNRNYVHHVEITSAEDIGVGDRGGYYDGSGAMRDMVQNHLLQLVGMVAMEPPTVVNSNAIRNEILKVFQSIRPIKKEEVKDYAIRGQYTASKIKGESVKGYREEKGVPEESRTPTYVALKFFIDNWRWGGVPFYIRTGKRLPTRVTEIVIYFRETPNPLFSGANGNRVQNNQLVIRIQPNEGILLKFGMKIPGMGFKVENVDMDFHYTDLDGTYLPSAYERLLLDAMLGDSTLYARGDAVEAAWAFVDPILEAWENDDSIPVYGYPAGTWGPENADGMIDGDEVTWRYPCRNLTDSAGFCEL